MSDRLFIRDQVQIDASKIEMDIDPVHGPTTIFKDVVIASEIVHEYEDGFAYKPADELEKAYWTWEGRWAIADAHPERGLLMDLDNIQGKTVNLRFVKNLNDHKTGRPNRRGILADLVVFDNKVSLETLTAMKNGTKRDVSIGFFFTKDATPGNWNGQDYSYAQRAFMGDHTAFGLELGRCSFPNCGIGADELVAAGDPFAGYETFEACIKDIMKENPDYTRKQAAGTCAVIEKRSKEKHKKDAEVKLSMEKARKWKSELDEILSRFDDLVEEKPSDNITSDMTLEEIEAKITELKENKAALRKKIDAIYAQQSKEEFPTRKLYEQLDEIEIELKAYIQAKVNKISADNLVEEEYQGNATYETRSEKARQHFSISAEEWILLSEEEKDDYISRLPPEKKRAGGEEMSEKDCTYEWDAVRAKILELPQVEPMVLSKIFGDMTFEEDSVTIPAETRIQLSELGVELDDCECDEEETEEEVVEDETVAEEVVEEEVDENEVVESKDEDLPSTEELLKDAERVWYDKERIVG